MKNFAKILFVTAFIIVANSYKAAAGPVVKGKDNDTSSLKSNIVIFKMITAPSAPAAPAKSLKKAGSVARTSNSHSDASPKPLPGES